MIKVKLNSDRATMPKRGTPYSAGLDLYSIDGYTLKPGQYRLFDTEVIVGITDGFVGLVKPRSGLAARYGIDTMAGVIDSDFRGSVGVILINHGSEPFTVEPGMRIAQLVIVPCLLGDPAEVDSLEETGRGANGYGHTGLK